MKAKDIMSKSVISIRKDTTIEKVIKTLLENEISGVRSWTRMANW